MDLTYKPYIDGLRAVAVIAVIIFHLNPEWLPGGYLGVDIFFVISGFVISQSLYKNYLKEGKVNIKEFYIRRFKRLYPALLAMVSVTTIFYVFFGFLWDVILYLKSAVAAVLAGSNLYFLYRGADYFHQDLVNPLLHTWSLGVEEQFYFVYPFLLALLLIPFTRYQLKTNFLAAVLFGLSTVSFAVFALIDLGPVSDFYSPLARFWELGAGCGLFFLSQYKTYRLPMVAPLAATVMLIPVFLNTYFEWIQLETLVTVLGTALLIYAGLELKNSLVVRFLAHDVTTYIGRISYSLYLWHLPVMYFMFLYVDSFWYYAGAPAVSFIFAAISYHYLEKPLRYSIGFETGLRKSITYLPYAAVVVVFVLVLVGPRGVNAFINQSFNDASRTIKETNYIESTFSLGERISPNYTLSGGSALKCSDEEFHNRLTPNEAGFFIECLKTGGGKDFYYLTGDSHSFHFLTMFDNSELIEDLYFIEVPRRNLVHRDPAAYDPQAFDDMLATQVEQLTNIQADYENVYLFTSFFFSKHQEQVDHIRAQLKTYIETLGEHATLVFIAPTPVFTAGPESCVLLGRHCEIDRTADEERRATVLALLTELTEEHSDIMVYDPYYEICPENTCQIYNPDTDFLRYIDKDHISPEMNHLLVPHFDRWLQETVY